MAVTISWPIVARHHGRACAEAFIHEFPKFHPEQVAFFLDRAGEAFIRVMFKRGVEPMKIITAAMDMRNAFLDRLAILEAAAIVD